MRQLLFFVFILFSLKFNAQVWVNPNAVWSFDYSGISEGGTFRWRYTHDSLIQGRTVQVLKCEKHQFVWDKFGQMHGNLQDYGNHYTSVSGDTVFYLKNDQFYVHVGFNNFPIQIATSLMQKEQSSAYFVPDCHQIEIFSQSFCF